MNKKELTAQVAKRTGLPTAVASKTINAVFDAIRENLEKGEATVVMGFGSFAVNNRAERRGINPSTKESLIIPACKVVKFSASKTIKLT